MAIASVLIMQAVLFLFICHTLKHVSVYESFNKHTIHTVHTKVYLTSGFCSGELRNGALQIWRGVVCFSRDFTFRINILNSISTLHKHSFFITTNVLCVSRDLPHSFLALYFNPNLHHFINNTCNLIHHLRFVNYNVSC